MYFYDTTKIFFVNEKIAAAYAAATILFIPVRMLRLTASQTIAVIRNKHYKMPQSYFLRKDMQSVHWSTVGSAS